MHSAERSLLAAPCRRETPWPAGDRGRSRVHRFHRRTLCALPLSTVYPCDDLRRALAALRLRASRRGERDVSASRSASGAESIQPGGSLAGKESMEAISTTSNERVRSRKKVTSRGAVRTMRIGVTAVGRCRAAAGPGGALPRAPAAVSARHLTRRL